MPWGPADHQTHAVSGICVCLSLWLKSGPLRVLVSATYSRLGFKGKFLYRMELRTTILSLFGTKDDKDCCPLLCPTSNKCPSCRSAFQSCFNLSGRKHSLLWNHLRLPLLKTMCFFSLTDFRDLTLEAALLGIKRGVRQGLLKLYGTAKVANEGLLIHCSTKFLKGTCALKIVKSKHRW